MNITTNNCQSVISSQLCSLPCGWKTAISSAICLAFSSPVDCNRFKGCETVTSLSDFTVTGNQVCVTFTDETGTAFDRCFTMDDTQVVITADNGLSKNSPTNVELGSPTAPGSALLHTSYIDTTSAFNLVITGSKNLATGEGTVILQNTGTGRALYASAVSSEAIRGDSNSGNGIVGTSISSVGGQFNSTSGTAALQSFHFGGGVSARATTTHSTTNTVIEVTELIRASTGTPADGIGGSINMLAGTTSQPTGLLANQIIWKWTTAADASRTSELSIKGLNNAINSTLLTLSGNGQLTLNQYGIDTFRGTPIYPLGVTSTGKVVESNGYIRKDYLEETPLLQQVPYAGVSDSILSVVKNGAMTTATIARNGNFDQFAVTNGDNTSYIEFTNLRVCDNRNIIRARVKVDSYRTNGSIDCIVGVGYFGQQASHDTGGIEKFSVIFNLTQRTISYFDSSSNTFGDVTSSFKVSTSTTLASSGDMFDIVLQRTPEAGGFNASLTNVMTGEFITGKISNSSTSRSWGIENQHLRFFACNGTFTLLDMKAYASTPAKPLLYTMGDSYASGDPNIASTTFPALIMNDATLPYHTVCGAGNGAYVVAMAQYQLPEVLKLKPRYVLLMTILAVFYGFFDDGDSNQTEFDNAMNNILEGITSYGGVPILVKWQTAGGFINGNSAAWNTKIAALQVSYPTIIILDLSSSALALNLSSHPNGTDHIIIKNAVVALLQAQGAI